MPPLPQRQVGQKIESEPKSFVRKVQPEVVVRDAPKAPNIPPRPATAGKAPSLPRGFAPKMPPRFPMAPKSQTASSNEASKEAPKADGKLKIIQIKLCQIIFVVVEPGLMANIFTSVIFL